MPILLSRSFAIFLLTVMTASSLMAPESVAASEVVASIQSHGPVQVGDVRMPSVGALFAGDRVATNKGVALIRYASGAGIMLASESRAKFAQGQVQLETGLMTIESGMTHGVVFLASTIRMQPTSPTISGNVTLREDRISILLTQGTMQITDASGVELALMRGGEARFFEVPSTRSLIQLVRGRYAKDGTEAVELFLAVAEERAEELLRDAKRMSIYTEGATAYSEIATKLEELEILQRQLAVGKNLSPLTLVQLNAIISTLNSANASLRPCETPAAVRAASPSRVLRTCH